MNVKRAKRAVWAPSIVEKEGKYYLFFGANDIQNDQQQGGIGIAVAEKFIKCDKNIIEIQITTKISLKNNILNFLNKTYILFYG